MRLCLSLTEPHWLQLVQAAFTVVEVPPNWRGLTFGQLYSLWPYYCMSLGFHGFVRVACLGPCLGLRGVMRPAFSLRTCVFQKV